MSRIAEIISSGRAPGFINRSLDPGCPQVAVPRALHAMECEIGSRSKEVIEQGTQCSTRKLKRVWFEKQKRRV
jgi:hypothetical protein